jgi:membrane-bound lytic murein transglycosylase F
MSFRQRIAWAVRPNSPQLLASVNAWIVAMKLETDFYVIYNKYFKNKKNYRMRAKSEYYSKTGGRISPYDDQLEQFSANLNWDWRLLAAQVYQESRFDPGSCSWMGACGLMQLMPATAKRYGITDLDDPDQNLRAGTRYLQSLTKQWTHIPDSVERIKFILASYNAGPGHIQDACRLAEKYGKDPLVWTNNVDEYVVLKSKPAYYNDAVVTFGYCRGQEPFDYVNEILTRYEDYRQHIN